MTDHAALFDAIRKVKGEALTQADVDIINAALGVSVGPATATGAKHIGSAGLALIKSFEGLRLDAYPDPATGGEPVTIGYGHTGGVKLGTTISETVAEQFLRADLARFEAAVTRLAPKTTQNQFDALVSFAFNLGEGNLASSGLLKKHNAGDYAGARAEYGKWVYANGSKMTGLVRRRAAEAALYAS